jgi:hypothetical protein
VKVEQSSSIQERRSERIRHEPIAFAEPWMFPVDEDELYEYLRLELKRLQPER